MAGSEQQLTPCGLFEYGTTTCDSTADRIVPTSAGHSRSIIIQSIAANTVNVYLGDASVATTTGLELKPDRTISMDLNVGESPVYGRTASGSVDLRFWIIR
jgi:hypothetical protein